MFCGETLIIRTSLRTVGATSRRAYGARGEPSWTNLIRYRKRSVRDACATGDEIRQEFAGRAPGELPKVPDQVRLVKVAAVEGDVRPSRRGVHRSALDGAAE